MADDYTCPNCGGPIEFMEELKKRVVETILEIQREENERIMDAFILGDRFGDRAFKKHQLKGELHSGWMSPPEGVRYFDYPGPAPTDGAGETLDG